MDLSKIITELRNERELLNEAILILERLAGLRQPRGRPSANAIDLQPEALQARAAFAGSDESGSAG